MSARSEKKILLIDHDLPTLYTLERLLTRHGYRVVTSTNPLAALDLIYNDPPDLLLAALDLPTLRGDRMAAELKGDTIFGHLPFLLLLPEEPERLPEEWQAAPFDDYLVKPLCPDEALRRIAFNFARASRAMDVNPLTRLPGNTAILCQIQGRLDAALPFALAYADLDAFKAFNDTYGFARGDEILRMVARLLTNTVRELQIAEAFIGHIGGDDFALILPPEAVEEVCGVLLRRFDAIVPTFYDEADRLRGWIETKDRQGRPCRYPLMTLSIGVAGTAHRYYSHYGEICGVANEMKRHAKTQGRSNIQIDRRRAPAPAPREDPPLSAEAATRPA